MAGGRAFTYSLATLVLCACQGNPPTSTTETAPAVTLKQLDTETLAGLQTASCPDTAKFLTPQAIPLTVNPINPETRAGAKLDGLTFAGGWHLMSDEPNFGGLSGLTVHPKDHILAVSDAGAFIWISMRDNAPSGYAAISYMLDETGVPIDGKTDADAEGLELVDGLAFVSLEHNHRILAFDLANCGAAANGITLAQIPARPKGLGRTIPDNEGAEALTLSAGGTLVAGLETKPAQGAPILSIAPNEAVFSGYIPRPNDKRLVGLDMLDNKMFSLFRSYSPLTGNANEIHAHAEGDAEPTILARLKRPFPVDNFEGITATRLPDGTVRLYIISDDNFSNKQRTLLMAFDVVGEDTLAN